MKSDMALSRYKNNRKIYEFNHPSEHNVTKREPSTVAHDRVIMNAIIVFYFGIHILDVKSNPILSNGSDNSALTFNKVNNNDPSSTSKANTFEEMNDEIRIPQNGKFLNEMNFNTTRKNIVKREDTPITSSQIVGRITDNSDTDFEATVLDGKLVVDKTRFIPKLLKKEKSQFIMLRPYRFGKSFFLSMLKAFFKGDKNLFCPPDGPKMDICNNIDYTWEKYTILSLNFGALGSQMLDKYIINRIGALADKYEVDKNLSDMDALIEDTFKAIYKKEKKRVVVLVDEYDLPVIETYFNNETHSRLNEKTIKDFLGSLKSWSSYIHITFIFGATRMTTVGQTLNILTDLTQDEEYSDLVGFTEGEIMGTYKERLEEIVHKRNLKNIKMLFEEILQPYYNSYRFTRPGISVFNPLSITTFLVKNPEKPEPYWAEAVASRDLLKNTAMKFSNTTLNLIFGQNRSIMSKEKLKDKLDRNNIMLGDETELAKIFFQTGHMTIKETTNTLAYCDLGVVNEEAKWLLESCLREKARAGPLEKMEDMLQQYNFDEFIDALEKALSDITCNKHFKREIHYERIVSFLLENKDETKADVINAVMTSARMSQFEIGENKYADYVKIMPFSKVAVIFYLKKYDPQHGTFNTTFELMKCHSAYVKVYADEHPENNVMCIVLIFYTGANQSNRVRNERIKNINREYIMDWAALEWFREEKEVQEHNIDPALNDKQREEVAEYGDMDQRRKKQVPKKNEYIRGSEEEKSQDCKVSEKLIPAAKIFKDETPLLSLDHFTKLIQRCKYPAKDGVEIVKSYTSNTKGVIELIDKCYALVNNRWLKLRLKKIKNALEN